MSTQSFSRILGMTYPAGILFLAAILAWSGRAVGEVPIAHRLSHLPQIKIFESAVGSEESLGDLTLEPAKSSLD